MGITNQALGMEGASTTHKEEDDGQAPRLLDAPVKIQDQEGNDREGLDFMWGTDKVGGNRHRGSRSACSAAVLWPRKDARGTRGTFSQSERGWKEGYGE